MEQEGKKTYAHSEKFVKWTGEGGENSHEDFPLNILLN